MRLRSGSSVRPGGGGFIGGDHRVLGGGSDDIIGVHASASFRSGKVSSLSR